jgi:hypothetical protein
MRQKFALSENRDILELRESAYFSIRRLPDDIVLLESSRKQKLSPLNKVTKQHILIENNDI